MEAAASVAVAARGISMVMQSSRKEWRVVSDHPVQSPVNEDLDRSKLGQGDERLIYEAQQGRESVGLDFFSVAAAGGSDHELRLDDVVKQREQLQHLEVNLKARLIARSEVIEMQERFDSQIKEHISANLKLQEQLLEREKTLKDLQRSLEDKDKELHSIRLDHEAAWAKEDLLREQNKELATFRRERDNSEAERAQHLKNIHDLQEHIQEKDQQLNEMQEQHRVAQETLLYKDEQIREAQAWISRAQEMDVLQSTTNHSLQAELRERMEQYNQLWLGCQRQFAEMERLHLHAVQQLQLELSEARERSDGTQKNLNDASRFANIKESEQEDGSGGSSPAADIARGSAESVPPSSSTQTNQIPAAQMVQPLHMPAYLPTGQLAGLHPFIMHQHQHQHQHQQGVNASHLPQANNVGQFHSSLPHWQIQQALSDGSQVPNHENDMRSESSYGHQVSVTGAGQAMRSDYSDAHISQGKETNIGQVTESVDGTYTGEAGSHQILQHMSSQFQGSLKLNHDNDLLEKKRNEGVEGEKDGFSENASEAAAVKLSEGTKKKKGFVGAGQRRVGETETETETEKALLLDEESLLACVVRTIPPPPAGRIRISQTLLNRLNKMLAPLNWGDYRRKYGELDDFLAVHAELFFIEGDHIQVREGAQEIIAAMAAHAKVRTAAALSSSSSSMLGSVAVTPMAAQSRMKKSPSTTTTTESSSRFMDSQTQINGVRIQNGHLPNGRPLVNFPTSQTTTKLIGRLPRSGGALPISRR